MERVRIQPRPDWQAKSELLGFDWHTPDGQTYWDESVYWKLSSGDVEHIQSVVSDGYAMLLDAIGYVIGNRQLPLFGYSPDVVAMIEESWENRGSSLALHGRFDLAIVGPQVKILEFNGDNPGNLFETSMVQRGWLKEVFPSGRQLNSIHELLISRFRTYGLMNSTRVRSDGEVQGPIHITCLTPNPEAEATAVYLQNVANEAGVLTKFVSLTDIGWQDPAYDDEDGYFVDTDGQEISRLLKLSPLGFMLQDDFGAKLIDAATNDRLELIEPAWRMLASNKRMLSVMWERNAYHPALLNTSTTLTPQISSLGYARKPFNGIDGQNIDLFDASGKNIDQTGGGYAEDQFIYQELAPVQQTDGNFAIVGAWVIDAGSVAAISVREAETPITDSAARFVPHITE